MFSYKTAISYPIWTFFLNILTIAVCSYWYYTDKSFESLVALLTGLLALAGQTFYFIFQIFSIKNVNNNYGNQYFFVDSSDFEVKNIENLNLNKDQIMGDQYNINMSNNYQSGGNNNPQVNFGNLPRKLNEQLKSQLLSVIDKSKGVSITSVMGDGEAQNFAYQIKDFLESEGFKITGFSQAMFTQQVKGNNVNPEKNAIIIGTNL